MKFIVVVQDKEGTKQYFGPYGSLKSAEGDVKAWDKIDGRKCWVEPLQRPVYGPEGDL